MYDWNIIEVPYCTSDDWLGTKTWQPSDNWFWDYFYFHGGTLVPAIFQEAVDLHGMNLATTVIHSGYSVGGLGVLNWFDRIYDQLADIAPEAEVYGLSDSGWWLWNQSYNDYDEAPYSVVFPAMYINSAATLHPDCVASGLTGECYSGEYVYPFINHKDRLLVSQQIFDKIHANSEGFFLGTDYTEGDYAHLEADHYLSSFDATGVEYLWASDCRNHDIIDSTDWVDIGIPDSNGVRRSLADSLVDFMDGKDVWLEDATCLEPDCNPTCPVFDQKEADFLASIGK